MRPKQRSRAKPILQDDSDDAAPPAFVSATPNADADGMYAPGNYYAGYCASGAASDPEPTCVHFSAAAPFSSIVFEVTTPLTGVDIYVSNGGGTWFLVTTNVNLPHIAAPPPVTGCCVTKGVQQAGIDEDTCAQQAAATGYWAEQPYFWTPNTSCVTGHQATPPLCTDPSGDTCGRWNNLDANGFLFQCPSGETHMFGLQDYCTKQPTGNACHGSGSDMCASGVCNSDDRCT